MQHIKNDWAKNKFGSPEVLISPQDDDNSALVFEKIGGEHRLRWDREIFLEDHLVDVCIGKCFRGNRAERENFDNFPYFLLLT